MKDIIKKQMKDVTVPKNDLIRRPYVVPETYVAPMRDDEGDRIARNPFFEKPQRKVTELKKERNKSRGIIFSLFFVVLLATGFFTVNYFTIATIKVTPVTKVVQLDNIFTASAGESNGELVFHFISLSEEKVKEVSATIEKKIQVKASGKVTIYNAYKTDNQRLIKNTRFESVDHKIFRTDESVVVPGAKFVNGKTIPGSVDAMVYADTPGKEYNIGTTNFTIPGFKGDPKYSKFYAVSKPDSPIAGGFDDTIRVPSDETIKIAQNELKEDLKKIAVEKARAQIPSGFSFFPGSMIVKFEEVPQGFTMSDTTNVSMRATISVFFFDTAELTEKIAELLPSSDRENPFSIINMPALGFRFVDPVDNVVFSDLKQIRFHMTGNADFVGKVDTVKIISDLVGKSKNEVNEIIKKQINISTASAVVRPSWKSVFPSDASKITVEIVTK